MDNKIIWLIVLIVALVAVDKILTYANIKAVEKNFPNIDKYSIEKNPVAKWFFQKIGLIGGSIIYFFISLIMFYFAWVLFTAMFKAFKVVNAPVIALYIVVMWYGLVITNNLFHLLRYTKVIS